MAAEWTLLDEVLELPRRQAASLGHVAHRPWPRPRSPWVIGQSWCDLLFAHWRVEAGALERFVPSPLVLETHAGSAWVGITPFVLRGLHARLLPPVPPLSSFCEANARTYVSFEGKPGILFLTLEASSRAAVVGGRLLAALPYRHARMTVRRRGRWIDYRSGRPGFRVQASYAAGGPPFLPAPGSLEAFLVERYCLYTTRAGRLWRVDIHHPPWALHQPLAGSGIEAALDAPAVPLAGDPHLHVAGPQHVVVWAPVPVARLGSSPD